MPFVNGASEGKIRSGSFLPQHQRLLITRPVHRPKLSHEYSFTSGVLISSIGYFSRVFRFGTRARKAGVDLLSSSLWRIRQANLFTRRCCRWLSSVTSLCKSSNIYSRLWVTFNLHTFIGTRCRFSNTCLSSPILPSSYHRSSILFESSQRATPFHPLCFNLAGRYSQIIYKPGY